MGDEDRVGREQRLRAAVLAGDESAWKAWYEATAPGLRAYVHWRCAGMTELADDIVQETWLTAIRKIRSFRPGDGAFSAWLSGIAANLIRNQLRKRRLCERLPHDVPAMDLPEQDHAEQIARALAEMPPRYESALRAKYLDGWSVQLMAEQWGESTKAVESLLTRARVAFRETMAAMESPHV